jgi:Cu/Zn superoxide dismutase
MRRHSQGVTSRIALAVALAGCLAACASDEEAKKPPPDPGVGAQLQPVSNSAIKGHVSFKQYDGGVAISVDVYGYPGTVRLVIHSTGNCTSPNGFSAGPPWIPPGATEPPMIRIAISDNLYGNTNTRLPGVRIDGPDGIRGKSVVVHRGNAGSLDAQPDVPNNRVACGVIETNKPLTF